MDNLLKNQKNIIIGAIITSIVLLALNMVFQSTFREACSSLSFGNPVINILLTALFAFLIAGTIWGFSSSDKGGHGNEPTVVTTSRATMFAAIATALVLFCSLVGGIEGLYGAETFVWIVGLVALFFLYLPALGPVTQKIGAAIDRALYQGQNIKTDASTKGTETAKEVQHAWLLPVIIVLVIFFVVLSRTSGRTSTDNESAAYSASASATATATPVINDPAVVTPATPTNPQQPEQEVGGGEQPR